MTDYQVIGGDRILELLLEPNWADAATDQHSCLVLDVHDSDLQGEQGARLAQWLRNQPVPIVSLKPLAGADLVVGEAQLDQVAAAIHRNPIASATLVQVLRATETLDVVQALTVESLAYAALQGGAEFARWVSRNRQDHPVRDDQAEDEILLLKRTGDRLELVLNSELTRNALSVAMRDALTEAFKLVAVDDGITSVDVRGNGPCFSAGGDLTEFGSTTDLALAHSIRMLRMPARYLAPHAERYAFHLHGACIGAGIELPAFAGRVVARADAFFQLPEVGFGLIPGAGGCVSIPRRIGRQRAARMAILGDRVDAEAALRWGLVDAIVD